MAERTATTWVCDRCLAGMTTEAGAEPEAWLGVTLADSPRAESGDRIHFCEECNAAFSGWLAAPTLVESEPEDLPAPEPEEEPGEDLPEPGEGDA